MILDLLKEKIFKSFPMDIKRTDIVLEIGSGNNPHFRSDILLDKYLVDSTERSTKHSIIIDRPFIVGDAIKLPFKDKSIDYTICRHLLEHLDNPKIFFSELMRVSKRGYIETPTELAEKLFGWKFHKWYINKKKDMILLTPKEKLIYSKLFYNIFHKVNQSDKHFHKFYQKNLNLFIMRYEWNNEVNFEIKTEREHQIKFESAKLDTNFSKLFKIEREKSVKSKLYLKFKKNNKGNFIWKKKAQFILYYCLS